MTTPTIPKSDNEILTIGVDGMTCASCVARVERALKKVTGVDNATVNLATEKATVTFDPDLKLDNLLKAIEGAGYQPQRDGAVFEVDGLSSPADAEALEVLLSSEIGVASAT